MKHKTSDDKFQNFVIKQLHNDTIENRAEIDYTNYSIVKAAIPMQNALLLFYDTWNDFYLSAIKRPTWNNH